MNLLEGKLARAGGKWTVEGEGLSVPVDEERFGRALVEGKKVSFGLRPHDLGPARGATPAGELKVEIVEALGFEAFAHGWVRSAGPTIVVRLDAADARATKSGTTLPLAVAPDKVHLFDAETGLSLDAAR
jgi:sn-glycerol 3-phosphate transport system ATP-binding protein/multiple sugar transport system ATP-binding protein